MKWPSTCILVLFLVLSACDCRDRCDNGFCKKRECVCDQWWEGDACDYSLFEMYEGFYQGSDSCDEPGTLLEFNFKVESTIPNRVNVGNRFYVEFTDRTRFTIPEQKWNGRSIQGEGEMLVNVISMNYHWSESDSGQVHTCLITADLVADQVQ